MKTWFITYYGGHAGIVEDIVSNHDLISRNLSRNTGPKRKVSSLNYLDGLEPDYLIQTQILLKQTRQFDLCAQIDSKSSQFPRYTASFFSSYKLIKTDQ